MLQKVRANTLERNEKMECFCKEIEVINEEKIQILGLNNTITKIKNSLDEFNGRMENIGRVSKLKDKSIEILQCE